MEIERQNLRKYLLGDLPEKLTEEIDLQIISDISLEDELGCAEDNLMEDYLEDRLSPREFDLFHINFLTSDERRNQLKHTKLIKEYAQDITQKVTSDELLLERPRSFTQKLGGFFEHNLRPLPAVFTLLVLCLLVGLSWRLLFYNPPAGAPARSENEVAELNIRDLTDLSALQGLSTVNLISGTFRDSSTTRQLSANQLSETVLFRLALPTSSTPGDLYRVKLQKDGQELFLPVKVPSYNNQSGREIRLILPSALLRPGKYEINVSQENLQGVITYPFSVQ
jgi:hypothetical protein